LNSDLIDLIDLIDLDFGLYFGLIGFIDSIGSIGLYFGLIDLFPMIDLNSYIIGIEFIFHIIVILWSSIWTIMEYILSD